MIDIPLRAAPQTALEIANIVQEVEKAEVAPNVVEAMKATRIIDLRPNLQHTNFSGEFQLYQMRQNCRIISGFFSLHSKDIFVFFLIKRSCNEIKHISMALNGPYSCSNATYNVTCQMCLLQIKKLRNQLKNNK